MRSLIRCTLSALLAAGLAGCAGAQPKIAPQPKEASAVATTPPAAPAGRGVIVAAAPPCVLARHVAELLGLLAPQIKPLPNPQSFAAANGTVKVVVACGMSADETYTYRRLLSNLGIGLLAFQGGETPQKVVQDLADSLKLNHKHTPLAKLPVTYLFPGTGSNAKELRFTVQAVAAAPAAPPAAARAAVPATAPAAAQATVPPPARATVPAAAPATARVTTPTKGAAAADPAAAAPKRAPAVSATNYAAVTATTVKPLAAKAASETLLDLYLLARAGDPELGRSRSRYLGSQADTDVSRAALLPRVNADFGLNYIDQSTYNSGPTALRSSVFGFNYDVIASAPLLHFSSHYNLASAKAAERGEEAGVAATRQSLILRLTQAYFGVLKSRGDEEIARDEITRVKQALEQAQAFLKVGTGDIIAVYEAQARLDSVLADLNRSESSLTLAGQRLSSIVGKVVPAIADQQPKQPKPPEPNDLEWWLSTMEKRDPQILQAQEGLNGSVEQTKSARADHLPVIDANAGFDVNKGAAYAPSVETRQWHLGASITVPLYSGGETNARIRRAGANEAERRYALDQVREQRKDNLKQAFFNLRYTVSLIRSLEQKEASALVQLNAIRKGRSIGTRTAIDLLNAEQAYSVAQRDLKNALYDNVVRVVELKAAAGILSEQDLAKD